MTPKQRTRRWIELAEWAKEELQKTQEEELRRNFSKEIDTNNPNVKLWLKLREDGK